MPSYSAPILFIRNLSLAIDTDESNQTPEDAGLLNGTYYPNNPSNNTIHFTNVWLNDLNADGAISDNHNAGTSDSLSYTLTQGGNSGTSFTGQLDVSFKVDVQIKTLAGTYINISGEALQMANGDIFLVDTLGNSTIKTLNMATIETIQLNRSNAANTTATDGFQLSQVNSILLCFGHGSLIATDQGERAIETLRLGDMVLTQDHGLQPITWIEGFTADEPLIEIAPGALGVDAPHRPLRLTKNHRVLVRSKIAYKMFGRREVFVYAKSLLALDGVTADTGPNTCYHLACARHEIIFANGLATETAYFGKLVQTAQPSLFKPTLAQLMGLQSYDLARPMPALARQRSLISRHIKNQIALVPPRVEHADC